MNVLILNAGSSSIKGHVFAINQTPDDTVPQPLWQAQAEWGKEKNQTQLKVKAGGQTLTETLSTTAHKTILKRMLETLFSGQTKVLNEPTDITVVGHRVVHGGPNYSTSVIVTPAVKAEIQRVSTFAPLHNPINLAGIAAAEKLLPHATQVAVFDTAFHSTMPDEASIYAGPYTWYEQGIRRYGFHGTSHQYCAGRSASILGITNWTEQPFRLVNCHLGNGCSLAAIYNGKSVETTMGFTPLEGLVMGSRSGTIDPGILLYLQQEQGYTADQIGHILNKKSGLLGLSGVSSDVRTIEKAEHEGNERDRLAMNIFVYRLRYFIGAMIAVLNGIDAITFTGGIGENDPTVRAQTIEGLSYLHVKLDKSKNAASPVDEDISDPTSAVRVLIVHTQEDWQIAKECWKVLHNQNTIGASDH
jgi:acetate kinase